MHMSHDKRKGNTQDRDDPQINCGKFTVYFESHEKCHNQHNRGTYSHTDDHLIGILDIGNVGGHTGDQAGCGKMVDIQERKILYLIKHPFA